MVVDKVVRNLMNKGYENIQLGIPGLFVFHYSEGNINNVVMLYNVMHGTEMNQEYFEELKNYVENNFYSHGLGNLRILNLLFTYYPDHVKPMCKDRENHWIVDLQLNRLILYENQSEDYSEFIKEVDHILEEEILDRELGHIDADGENNKKRINNKMVVFSTMNISLIILNILVFVIVQNILYKVINLENNGALNWYYIKRAGEYYRFITSMFLHGDTSHLLSNMLILLVMGGILEKAIGKVRYLIIYFGAGLIAGISSISYNMYKDYMVYSIGASGAIFGVIGAIVILFIKNRNYIESFSIRRIIIFAALSLYGGIVNDGVDNIAHFGGFIAGLVLCFILYKKPSDKSAHKELLSTFAD